MGLAGHAGHDWNKIRLRHGPVRSFTVHVNGIAVRSCTMQVSNLSGKSVTTIEGISLDASHPIPQAWIEMDVPQCGYCQSGQIMSAASLLAKNAKPSDSDIDDAMKGNICRCGTYQRIREAVHRAAELHKASVKPSRQAGTAEAEDAVGEPVVEVGGVA